MKRFILSIFCLIFTLNFSACSSKTQEDITTTRGTDITELLRTIIEKEKEINELTKKLEACESQNEKQKIAP